MYTFTDPTLSEWFHNYRLDFSTLTRPPMLYEFRDLDLEEMAFTSSNNFDSYNMVGMTRRYSNPTYERLEWLGEGILKFLVGEALYATIPDLGGNGLMAISCSILNDDFLAYLSRRLGFHRRLSDPSMLGNDPTKRLAGTFQAYIGAFYEEIGVQNLHILHNWFRALIEPFVQQLHHNFLSYQSSRYGTEIRRPVTISPTSSRRYNVETTSRISSYHDETPRKPSRGLRSSAANDYPIPPRSSSTVPLASSEYTMQLKELTERMRRPMPEYVFDDNGQMGEAISWHARVYLNGIEYGNQWARSKKEAQHAASHEALERLKIERKTNLPYHA